MQVYQVDTKEDLRVILREIYVARQAELIKLLNVDDQGLYPLPDVASIDEGDTELP